jgi:hypothetical protein
MVIVWGQSGSVRAAVTGDAMRASRKPFTYAFQWGEHITPRPSFREGCFGNSLVGASWASMPKRVEPLQRRRVVLLVVIVVILSYPSEVG